MSTSVSMYDEEGFKDAIADVRADSTDTKWLNFYLCEVCVQAVYIWYCSFHVHTASLTTHMFI